MSGPVVDGLAQLEDAATEAGLDLAFVFKQLENEIEKVDAWLEHARQPPPSYAFRRVIHVRRQKLWDQLAVLSPSWALRRVARDHEMAWLDQPLAA